MRRRNEYKPQSVCAAKVRRKKIFSTESQTKTSFYHSKLKPPGREGPFRQRSKQKVNLDSLRCLKEVFVLIIYIFSQKLGENLQIPSPVMPSANRIDFLCVVYALHKHPKKGDSGGVEESQSKQTYKQYITMRAFKRRA